MSAGQDQLLRNNARLLVRPSDPEHLVPKWYVDAAVEGMLWGAVSAASTQNLDVVMDKQAMTLTGSGNGAVTTAMFDGVVLSVGNRVLVGRQTNEAENGIYEVMDIGGPGAPFVLKRTEDANESNQYRPGKQVAVISGTTFANEVFMLVIQEGVQVELGETPLKFDIKVQADYAQVLSKVFDGAGFAEFTVDHTLQTDKVIVQVWSSQNIGECEEGVPPGTLVQFGIQILNSGQIRLGAGSVVPAGIKYTVVIAGQSATSGG